MLATPETRSKKDNTIRIVSDNFVLRFAHSIFVAPHAEPLYSVRHEHKRPINLSLLYTSFPEARRHDWRTVFDWIRFAIKASIDSFV